MLIVINFFGDYKVTINQASQTNSYPLTRVDDLFAALSGGTIFTKLDLSHAYQQILLDEEPQIRMLVSLFTTGTIGAAQSENDTGVIILRKTRLSCRIYS